MGSVDQVDDRTFRVNFTGEGAEKLRDRVNDKLKEFMGDYTDETLVDYVIVLLKNGRRKEEARNELNVFLGDDTDAFVSWLWDHLASNIGLYVQSEESCVDDEVIKSKSLSSDKLGRSDSAEADRVKPDRESKIRHNREWKGLVRDASDPPPLRSSEIENIQLDEKSHRRRRRTKRSQSPRLASQRKRSRADERQDIKREAAQVNTGATRRLLQFAVRDALGTSSSTPSNTTTEAPVLKRLRSVVSTPTGDSPLVDHPPRIKSVARLVNPMASVIKAVAEAAEDAVRVKSSGSVFDRLGRGMGISRAHDLSESHMEGSIGDEDGYDSQLHNQRQSTYYQRTDHNVQYSGNMTMLGNGASDFTSKNERYDDANAICHNGMDISERGAYGGDKDEDLMTMDYSVAQNSQNLMRVKRNKVQDLNVASNISQKIMNVSANANTWRPRGYQEPKEVAGVVARKPAQEVGGGTSISGTRIVRDISNHLVSNGNNKTATDCQTELQKTVLPSTGHVAGRPLEDADSRTLFVSNVHFAATKDSLSCHFNKFGDVLKVIILTDAATGQLTGSAYVEFMRKEAADSALSLDGTSFMSRLLKVVKRSAAQQETAMTTVTWPRMTRGTPFATARFPRASFPTPRGMVGSFRGRPLFKPGARSFQWKRDAQPSSSQSVVPLSNNPIPSPTTRSLTYVRSEPKPEANTGTA